MGVSVVVLPVTKLIDAKTTSGYYVPMPKQLSGQYVEATYYVVFDATSSAGAVVIETAHAWDYSGTWANLATISWAANTSVKSASVTGTYAAIRVRISTTVADGTCDVWAVATSS